MSLKIFVLNLCISREEDYFPTIPGYRRLFLCQTELSADSEYDHVASFWLWHPVHPVGQLE